MDRQLDNVTRARQLGFGRRCRGQFRDKQDGKVEWEGSCQKEEAGWIGDGTSAYGMGTDGIIE
jgi:hypothetical protein